MPKKKRKKKVLSLHKVGRLNSFLSALVMVAFPRLASSFVNVARFPPRARVPNYAISAQGKFDVGVSEREKEMG